MESKTIVVGVTGGSGFIGKKIVSQLQKEGFRVISLQRGKTSSEEHETRYFDLCSIETINEKLLHDIDILIHAAALVHNTKANSVSFTKMNVEATKKFHELSVSLNMKKFIFLSTVGVYGKSSHKSPIDINFPTEPQTDYGKSKLQSEHDLLHSDYKGKELKISIIRLPLVIGENAPGNYGLLEKLSKTKFPLPFGCADNRRTVVSLKMVVDAVVDGCKNIELHQGLNLLAEESLVSTKELLENLRKKMGASPNLLPIPKFLMKTILIMIGKKKIYEQLFEDLTFTNSMNISKS